MDTAYKVIKAANPQSLVILSLGGTVLYWQLPRVRPSKFADSHFFTSPYAPLAWNTEALHEAEEADIIVLTDDDNHPHLSGHVESTSGVLLQRPEWVAMFKQRHLLYDDGKWSVWSR